MKEREIRGATHKEAIIALIIILASFIAGFLIFEIDGIIVLGIGAVLAGIFAWYLGYNYTQISEAIATKVSSAVPAILILLCIGLLVGTWMAAGVIPAMIYYGLQVVNIKFIFLTAFIVCIFISISTGTSWGTVGTIGVALMGIATGLDIPLPMMAGAVISGAYFGDKMSPLSDTTNMSALAAGADLYDHIKQMLVTTVPSMIIAGVMFTVLGFSVNNSGSVDVAIYKEMLFDLSANFNFNILLILPPCIVIGGAILKKPTVPTLIVSSFVAIMLAVVFQRLEITEAFGSALSGFNTETMIGEGQVSASVMKLLNRGGLTSMYNGVIYVLIAFAFGGILDLTKVLEIALRQIMKPIKTVTSVAIASGLSALTVVGIAQNSYISFFLVSDIFKKKFNDLRLKPQNLSRIMEDFVTILEGLLPWTVSGIYMATTLGVATKDYAVFAFFNLLCPLISIFYAITYKTIGKKAFSYFKEGEKINE